MPIQQPTTNLECLAIYALDQKVFRKRACKAADFKAVVDAEAGSSGVPFQPLDDDEVQFVLAWIWTTDSEYIDPSQPDGVNDANLVAALRRHVPPGSVCRDPQEIHIMTG